MRRSAGAAEANSVFVLAAMRRHNLPAQANSFIGRESDRAEVEKRISAHRLVTLVGPGGVGKTALALRVAETMTWEFSEGVWLVELAELWAGDRVADAVREVLPDGVLIPSALDLGFALADRHLLLVLDNCEHLLPACAAFTASVLRSCPAVSVLATSREALGVDGEHIHVVQPLGLPEPGRVAGEQADSVRLFVERSRAVRPDFHLTAAAEPAVEALCRRLDGLPLAIELAAVRMAVLSPAEILAMLGNDLRLLADGVSCGPFRHRSLRNAIDWGYALLTDEEAALWTRLAVFPGGFDLAGAEAVCAGDVVEAGAILDLLTSLVAKSMVILEPGQGAGRYRMLEVVRSFARARLEASAGIDTLLESHARWCIGRAEQAGLQHRAARPERWFGVVDRRERDFSAALVWARDHGRGDVVVRLGAALGWFWEACGRPSEGIGWLRWGLAHAPSAEPDVRARALRTLGILTWLDGDVAGARSLVGEAMDVFRAAGMEDEASECACLSAFHVCAPSSHSARDLEVKLVSLRDAGERGRLVRSVVNCGTAYFFVGDTERARECYETLLGLPAGIVDEDVVVDAEVGRGRIAVMTGNLAAGEASFVAALEAAEMTGDVDGRSTALAWLGEVCRVRGELASSREYLAEAMAVAEHSGRPLSVARCQQFRARLDAAAGELTAAREMYSASLSASVAAAMPNHRMRSLQGLAEVACAMGERCEARCLGLEALALADAYGDTIGRAASLTTLARLAHADGDAVRALGFADEAFDLQAGANDAIGMWDTIETLAELAAAAGQAKVAVRLFGVAERAREHAGCMPTLFGTTRRVRDLPLVAGLLRSREWVATVGEGRAFSCVEAVAYARRKRVTAARPPAGWDSLTPVERRVADLAAEHLSSTEIGRSLLISVRTVSAHLTHVYRKLGVANRGELMRAARRHVTGTATPSTALLT